VKKEARDNNKLWPKNPIHEGIPTEKGPRQQVVAQNPIHEEIPTERAPRQQQVVAQNPIHEGISTEKSLRQQMSHSLSFQDGCDQVNICGVVQKCFP
jgi:hypothetical protein